MYTLVLKLPRIARNTSISMLLLCLLYTFTFHGLVDISFNITFCSCLAFTYIFRYNIDINIENKKTVTMQQQKQYHRFVYVFSSFCVFLWHMHPIKIWWCIDFFDKFYIRWENARIKVIKWNSLLREANFYWRGRFIFYSSFYTNLDKLNE